MSNNIQNLYLNLIVKKNPSITRKACFIRARALFLLTVTSVPKTELYI